MMQQEFENEIKDKCYSESDFKKIARELNVLYEQNQELHKLTKRLKFELRVSKEREREFVLLLSNTSDEMGKIALA